MDSDEREIHMTDIHEQNYDRLIARQVVDQEGNKIGKVSDIYRDELTGQAQC